MIQLATLILIVILMLIAIIIYVFQPFSFAASTKSRQDGRKALKLRKIKVGGAPSFLFTF